MQRELMTAKPISKIFWKCNPSISTGNLFVTKSLFETVAGFRDFRANHDWDFCLRASEWSEPCFVDVPLYGYRLHGANTISESVERNRLEADQILSEHLARAFDPSVAFANSDALNCQNRHDEFVQCLFDAGVARLMEPALFRHVVQELIRITRSDDAEALVEVQHPRTVEAGVAA